MLFSVACALLDGKVTPDSFEDERFLDDDVLALIGRSEVVVLDEFNAATPQIRNCRITAKTAGGEDVVAHRVVTLDDIKRGMPRDDLVAKFRECTRRAYTTRQQDAIIEAVDTLDTLDDVSNFATLLDL